ncbi:MAG: hypothetical protein FWE15_19500 [Actinomycetia bacterium]|uniref:hypothetical protein n=1 Tax=Streptomyces sp. NPDC020917 TaxID=3365102 RepID=UPI0027EEF067|nr:hypothetical protein [Actinomycetes bacterium]
MEQSMPAVESELVDLTGVSLEALRSLDEDSLAAPLAALLRRIDDPQAIAAGYNQSRSD